MNGRSITNKAWLRSVLLQATHLLSIITMVTVVILGMGPVKVAQAAPQNTGDAQE
ncbi:MAG: hypothetical protein IMY86_11735 [Chloroflexi bacterium]|jgi:hypothetical protein|nr:hypothetical protein [Chloroflexota bacterium]